MVNHSVCKPLREFWDLKTSRICIDRPLWSSWTLWSFIAHKKCHISFSCYEKVSVIAWMQSLKTDEMVPQWYKSLFGHRLIIFWYFRNFLVPTISEIHLTRYLFRFHSTVFDFWDLRIIESRTFKVHRTCRWPRHEIKIDLFIRYHVSFNVIGTIQ